MADDADLSQPRIEAEVAIEMARVRNAGRELEPVGVCHWCMEPLRQANQLFCDSLCADYWQDNKRRNGA